MAKASKKKSTRSSKKKVTKKKVAKKKGPPINVRKKGHDFEREVCNSLRHIFPNVERSQEGSSLDQNGVDIQSTNPFLFQCKRNRGYASVNTINEIKIKDGIPVLLTRADKCKAMAVLPFSDLINLIERAYGRAPGEEETEVVNNVEDDSILSEEDEAEIDELIDGRKGESVEQRDKNFENLVDDLI